MTGGDASWDSRRKKKDSASERKKVPVHNFTQVRKTLDRRVGRKEGYPRMEKRTVTTGDPGKHEGTASGGT